MGPILPQINVFGKQLGISPDIMGFVTSVLPIMYVLAKPIVGYLIDYFPVSDDVKSTIGQLPSHRLRGSEEIGPQSFAHQIESKQIIVLSIFHFRICAK